MHSVFLKVFDESAVWRAKKKLIQWMNFFEDHALPIVELIIPFTSQQVLCLH